MANVLPPKERLHLKYAYWLRLGVATSFVLSAAILIGLASLVPAYILARTELTDVMRYQEIQDQTREAAKNDIAVVTTRFVNAQINELKNTEEIQPTHAITMVMRDWSVHAENIIMSAFAYDFDNEAKLPRLRISGQARDRSTLNAFVQTLRTDSNFSSVSFPVSNLVGEGTVDFSIVLLLEV